MLTVSTAPLTHPSIDVIVLHIFRDAASPSATGVSSISPPSAALEITKVSPAAKALETVCCSVAAAISDRPVSINSPEFLHGVRRISPSYYWWHSYKVAEQGVVGKLVSLSTQ